MSYRPYYGRRPRNSKGVVQWIVGIGALVVVAGVGYVIFAEDEPDALAVCMNPVSNERVSDDMCGDYGDDGSTVYSGGFHYMMFDTRTYRGNIPAVGQKMPTGNVTGYKRTFPKSTGVIGQKVKPQGGSTSTIKRGGFGVSSGVKAGTSGGS